MKKVILGVLMSLAMATVLFSAPRSKSILRSTPRFRLSQQNVRNMLTAHELYDFNLNRSAAGFPNSFEKLAEGQVVFDYATGLLWQQSGSHYRMFASSAGSYIDSLNRVQFGGFSDWRLPTLEEAMTLMEPGHHPSGKLFIDPVFDPEQWWIMTADQDSAYWAWVVFYSMGYCSRHPAGNFSVYVRAVRGPTVPGEDPQVPLNMLAMRGNSLPFPQVPQRSGRFRSQPQKHLSAADVRFMIYQYDFYCSRQSWSAEYSNAQGAGFANHFEKRPGGAVVLDLASGLVWQQWVPQEKLTYQQALKYIAELNSHGYGGYTDWRLPTLEEAMTLVEPSPLNGNLNIDPVFEEPQTYIWTADQPQSDQAWVVVFKHGGCLNVPQTTRAGVRAVR